MKETEHLDYLLYKLIHSGTDINEKLAQDFLSVKVQALATLIHIVKGKRYWHSKDENERIAPLTAMHLLSATKEPAALEAIIYAIHNYREEIRDWFSVISSLLANFGTQSFDRISTLLFENDLEYWIKEPIAKALIIISKLDNDVTIQKKTIDILKNAISLEKDRTTKSFLVMLLTDLKDNSSKNFIKCLFDNDEIDQEITTYQEVLDVFDGKYDENIQRSYCMQDPIDYFKAKDFFSSEIEEDYPQSYTFLGDDYDPTIQIPESVNENDGNNYNDVTSKELKVRIGRNDLCLCGSGKKYKKCCMNKSNKYTNIHNSQ
ncbi:MAG TPA: SEC-C domain-containing protein [Candidatus Nitrosocosmicus sp.]